MGGLPGCWIMTGKESTNWNFHLDLWGWICFLWAFSQAFSLFQGSVWRGSKQICWNKHFHSSQCPADSSTYHHNTWTHTFLCVLSYLHWLSFSPWFYFFCLILNWLSAFCDDLFFAMLIIFTANVKSVYSVKNNRYLSNSEPIHTEAIKPCGFPFQENRSKMLWCWGI